MIGSDLNVEQLSYLLNIQKRSLDDLERRLTSHKYICSNEICIADLVASSELESARFLTKDLELLKDYPKIKNWFDSLQIEYPVLRESFQESRKMVDLTLERLADMAIPLPKL